MTATRRTIRMGWLQGEGCNFNNNGCKEDNIPGLVTATSKICQSQQQWWQGEEGTGNNNKEQPSEWQQLGWQGHGQWQELARYITSTVLARTGYTKRTSTPRGPGNDEDDALGQGNKENEDMGASQWWVRPSGGGGQWVECGGAKEWADEESATGQRHEHTRQSSGEEEMWACHWMSRGGDDRRQGRCLRKWGRPTTKWGGGLWWGPRKALGDG